ncbi:MAG TPA: acetolactate synthase small subunit [Acidobacteriota bacterium]|jgi:acetolactate synthase-1/3 small subunit
MLHTLVAYVEDKPGVLNRVASLFRRRAFNIESLTVGHTEKPGVSRMTIVIDSDQTSVLRVEQNLYKLVNVLRVDDVTEIPSVIRDLALIKMRAAADTRSEILQIVDVFRARVVDATTTTLILEVTGSEAKIEALLDLLRPFGILEMVRTGSVAMARGEPLLKQEQPDTGEEIRNGECGMGNAE